MKRRWLWRRLTANLGWKLTSVLLAALLWFAMVGEPELVAIQPIPVLYRNLPKGLLLLSDAPSQVQAELRGPSGRLTRETLSDVIAAVDLAGVTGPGTRSFTLSQADFNLPQGVAFMRAVPSQVSLHFDWLYSKSVPVTISLSGALPPGYRLVSQAVAPGTLEISGPQGAVSGIQSAQTDPVDLSGVTADVDVKVNAFVEEKRAQFTSAPEVTVHLTIEKTEGSH